MFALNLLNFGKLHKNRGLSIWSYWKKKYEQGEDPKPSSDNTSKLANYFGVTVDYLLTGKEPEQKEKPSGLPAGLDTAQYTPEQLEVLNAVTEKIQTEEGCQDMYNLLKAMHIL